MAVEGTFNWNTWATNLELFACQSVAPVVCHCLRSLAKRCLNENHQKDKSRGFPRNMQEGCWRLSLYSSVLLVTLCTLQQCLSLQQPQIHSQALHSSDALVTFCVLWRACEDAGWSINPQFSGSSLSSKATDTYSWGWGWGGAGAPDPSPKYIPDLSPEYIHAAMLPFG